MNLGFIQLTLQNGTESDIAYSSIESMLDARDGGTLIRTKSGDEFKVKEPRTQVKAKIQVQREL